MQHTLNQDSQSNILEGDLSPVGKTKYYGTLYAYEESIYGDS